ncbi:MAG: hypothetical protein IKN82_06940 [Treponema sp.]|nr:hypothetical protein [Treponema sp.]
MFRGLSKEQKAELEYEIISDACRLKITRLLRAKTNAEDSNKQIILINRIINIARQVEGLSICQLESDDDGCYFLSEKAWHFGELELISRRETTCELIETLCDLISANIITSEEINEIFDCEKLGIFIMDNSNEITVDIVDDFTEEHYEKEHPNIRILIKRMDLLLENSDYPGVLHASASIFETHAKSILNKETIEDKSLGSFFEAYKKELKLPESFIDEIKALYSLRNTEPLAGHGSTKMPTITKEDAVIIDEMTKSFIKIERKLRVL